MTDDPKYPDIEVQLTGGYGNAGAILSSVSEALKREGVSLQEVNEFRMEALSGDYDHLLRTCMKWVEVS